MTDAEILDAVSSGTHVLVPIKHATNAITGHAPLDLSGIETPAGEFAVYIDGLTSEEASSLLKIMWRRRPKEPA